MRKLILFLLLIIFAQGSYATECTEFLKTTCGEGCKVKIVSKEEHCNPYDQKIGDCYVTSIVYGNGSLKLRKCRKTKISYICLIGENGKPFWGYIIPR